MHIFIVLKIYLLVCFNFSFLLILIADENSNTFINVRFNGLTVQSSTVYQQRKPTFNSRMQLPYYAPLNNDPIEVQLWNHYSVYYVFYYYKNFVDSAGYIYWVCRFFCRVNSA